MSKSLSVLAWLRLARVFQKIDRISEVHLRAWDLNVAQFDVLAQVGSAKGITQQELANRLLVTKGNISQLLDRLERRGFIMRSQEGRTNMLFLTEVGQKLYAEAVPAQEDMVAGHFSSLTEEEQKQLLALLRKLDQAIC
jgi:DNA-binding MarR family transcriptional regulator